MNLSKRSKRIILQLTCCVCFLFTASSIFRVSISKSPTIFSQKNVHTLNDKKTVLAEDKLNAAFLVRATELFLLQIKYAQAAQTRAITVDVRELGKINEVFYTKKYLELIGILEAKKYSMPTSLNRMDEERLSNLFSIIDDTFDETLCDEIAITNTKAIEIFENIRGKTKDHLIIDITSISIPALYNQREYALLCQNKFQKK